MLKIMQSRVLIFLLAEIGAADGMKMPAFHAVIVKQNSTDPRGAEGKDWSD